jgi:nitroreductase
VEAEAPAVDAVIRARRTVKEYAPKAVPAGVIAELLELAVQAPNHHLTEPWRFWVVGPETIERMVAATGDRKLTRSSTAVVVGMVPDADPVVAREDEAACAAAIQTLLLAATGRGLATFWRTPGVARNPAFAAALGAPDGTRIIGWVHLGTALEPPAERDPRTAVGRTTWL